MNVAIKQQSIDLGSITVLAPEEKSSRESRKRPQIMVGGSTMKTTDRFWNSLYSRYNIGEGFFRYFTHAEVFERIKKEHPQSLLKMSIENDKSKDEEVLRALAVANVEREIAPFNQVESLLVDHNGTNITYVDGVITATFTPPSGAQAYKIGPDEFRNNYVIRIPVDGYGKPKIHLSLLRLLCTNGMVGLGKAFESEITATHDPLAVLTRALEAYDNDQGFDALASRVDRAQKSFASFREVTKMEELVLKTSGGAKRIGEYRKLTGFVQQQYGVFNPATISVKKQMLLPTRVRVSELIDYATELTSHQLSPKDGMPLQGFVGSLLCAEYDLEGSAEKVKEFADFHSTNTVVGSQRRLDHMAAQSSKLRNKKIAKKLKETH